MRFESILRTLINFIPNFLTLINLSIGVLGIIFAFGPYIEYAAICIIVASVFDFFDGFAARLLKAQSAIGKELDSLADLIAFGVLPGIIMYQLMAISLGQYFVPFEEREFTIHFWTMLSFLIPAGSAYRLAKFNIDTEQTENFKGLPTPAMAIFIAALPIIMGFQFGFNYFIPLDETAIANLIKHRYWDNFDVYTALYIQSYQILLIITIVLTALMVSNIPIISLKLKGFSWKLNEWRYIFAIVAALTLSLAFIHEIVWIDNLPFIEWVALPIIIVELMVLSGLRLLKK